MIIWTASTTIWSEAPNLSLMKSTAFALVVLAFVSAGIVWAKSVSEDRAFAYTIPIALLAIFAALGPGASVNTGEYGSVVIYRGLSGNANALGMLCAMGFIGAVSALGHRYEKG